MSQCSPEECEGGGWSSGPWSVCSVSCGYGVETRLVTCRPPGSRCEGERPLTSRHCRGVCSTPSQGSGWVRLLDGQDREDTSTQNEDLEEEVVEFLVKEEETVVE